MKISLVGCILIIVLLNGVMAQDRPGCDDQCRNGKGTPGKAILKVPKNKLLSKRFLVL